MKFRHTLLIFLITFAVSFLANVAIILFWNLFISHKGGVIDWETSFRIPLLLAIIIPFSKKWNR